MQDDDDPKTVVPAAPPSAPADDQDDADEKPEGDEPEGDSADEKTPTDDEDVGEDDEQDEGEEDDGEEDEGERKPSPRAKRKQRALERLRAENEALRSRSIDGGLPADPNALTRALQQRVYEEIGDPPDPNDPKYKDNYVRFEREAQAWINDQRQVTREVRKEFIGKLQREQERVAGLVADHKERVSRLRTKIKDFDQVMARASVPVAPHVERLILESKRSDRISYHLARDQSKLVRLNNMSPEAVAREIGRIEGRLSLPQPKAQTKARKPITPLRGGGTSPPSGLGAVNAYIKKTYGNRG